jgi:glycogen debranching enzyme
VVTPRRGKPVEIQALWYNALRVMESLAATFGDAARQEQCGRMAQQAQRSFNARFWNEAAGCLYDVVEGEERDASLRPNQVFAASLHHTMLSRPRLKQVVAVVERELLTPLGLRSLAPTDSRYVGRYAGDVRARDGAYHQGTVWPWLMGPFLTAYLRAHGGSRAARLQARAWLAPFEQHLCEAGLGQISEVADGDAPYRPGGCIAQAWSVAELLRAIADGKLMD